jgi:hypothetical protein
MTEYILGKLKYYIEESQKARGIIACLIQDLKYIKSGGAILYAVDFSEIYSYLIPTAVADEFMFLANRIEEDAILIQRSVLDYFFFKSTAKHILLPSYGIELEGFVARLKDGAYSDLFSKCLTIYKGIEKLEKTPPFYKAYEIVSKQANEITDKDIDDLYTFLNDYAPSLLNILNPPWEAPYTLLRELFKTGVFQNPSDLGIAKTEVLADKDIFYSWSEELISERGTNNIGSSIVDANAVAMINHINTILENRNVKILLVTRSKYMHKIMKRKLASGEASPKDSQCGNVLRHPISFYFQYGQKKRSIDEVIEALKQGFEILNFFLDVVGNETEIKSPRLDTSHGKHIDEITKHLNQIGQTWKSASMLDATTNYYSPNQMDRRKKKVFQTDIVHFFKFIDDTETVKKFLLKKLNVLHGELKKQHEYLGLYSELQTTNHETFIKIERYSGKYVIRTVWTNRQAMPYSFQFYSNGAGALLEKLGEHKSYSIDDALPIFINGFHDKPDYERLLSMAFILGSFGKWVDAEEYCKEAIKENIPTLGILPHEGYFFLAVCKRKHSFSIKRCREALDLLKKAISLKKATKRDIPDYQDPRLIHEIGVQVLKCRFIFGDQITVEDNIPDLKDGLNYLEKSLSIIENDEYLKVQALNNILYYYLNIGLEDNNTEFVKKYFNSLVETETMTEPNPELWPGAILDTVALSMWKLIGIRDREEYQKITKYFSIAQGDKYLEPFERQTISKHFKEFKASVSIADFPS